MAYSIIDEAFLPLQRAYHWESLHPNDVFLIQPLGNGVVKEFTWAQTMDEVRHIASYIRSLKLEPHARIAIMSKNTAWWIMSDLAIWMAGCVSVPIYPNLLADSVKQILIHSQACLCIIGKLDSWQTMRAGIPDGLACITTPLAATCDFPTWVSIIESNSALKTNPTYSANALATIIYTSGTTGSPKGAMHTFSAFSHTADALDENIHVTRKDRMLSYLPLAHVGERALVQGPALKHGLRIYFTDTVDTFITDLKRARPTIFFSVPRLWIKFHQSILSRMPQKKLDWLTSTPVIGVIVKRRILNQLGLGAVRVAGTGTAPMSMQLISWYRKLGLELLEGYGMTEQFGLATSNRVGQTRVGYVGSALACCQIKLSNESEVLTRGPAHMKGYFNEPEKTKETLTDDGWLRTGDLGEFDSKNRLRIIGRAKEQFKTSKGKYVMPSQIETKLSSFDKVEAFVVCGLGFAQPFAIATLPVGMWSELSQPNARREFVNELTLHLVDVNVQLDAHERLCFIAVVSDHWTVDSGLFTPTLKLRRAAIEKRYALHFETWAQAGSRVIWHLA